MWLLCKGYEKSVHSFKLFEFIFVAASAGVGTIILQFFFENLNFWEIVFVALQKCFKKELLLFKVGFYSFIKNIILEKYNKHIKGQAV